MPYNDVLNGKNISGVVKTVFNGKIKNGQAYMEFDAIIESFLMGKYGGAYVKTYWNGSTLRTIIIESGELTRYH